MWKQESNDQRKFNLTSRCERELETEAFAYVLCIVLCVVNCMRIEDEDDGEW